MGVEGVEGVDGVEGVEDDEKSRIVGTTTAAAEFEVLGVLSTLVAK